MFRKLRYMATGALIAYFFDPQSGSQRRAAVRDRISGRARMKAESMGQPVSAEARPDDATLARNVETEIFRDADIPKGRINVNAENGKVVLRGEVEQPELIKDLEQRTKKVQGVEEVENLLHVPGTPVPAK
jgi:osmotically-inducible protein OsmY